MGLFDFLNKGKQTAGINDINKREIMTTIEGIKANCKDVESLSMLRKLQLELQNQTATASNDVVAIDTKILDTLAKVQASSKRGQAAPTLMGLIDALELAIDRSDLCPVGGQLSKREQKLKKAAEKAKARAAKAEISQADRLQDEIDELEAENEVLQRKYNLLAELYKECPTNQAILSRCQTINARYNGNLTIIQNKKTLLERESSGGVIVDINARTEADIARSTYSDSEISIAMAQNREISSTLGAMNAQNQEMAALLNNGAMGFGNPLVTGNGELAPLGSTIGNGGLAPLGVNAAPGMAQAGAQQTQYGNFDASNMSSREMQQDIKRTINAIEKQIENCNDKIEDASDEFNDYNAQLRSLLTRRENASPSECLVLDGQIDELNSKRSSVMSKIKQYRQIKANLSDRLNLLEKLGTQQDITSMTASISEITGGRLGDIEGIAMYLKDSIAQGNEALENIGMAVAVSESEDINMGSLSATYAGLTDNTNVSVKDDHKYDNLMMDLGMPV